MTTRKNNYDVGDFRMSSAMLNALQGSFPVKVDWVREGQTAEHHPLGPGRHYIQGRVYSNGVYRQLIERPDGMWDDCIMERQKDGLVILEQRIVTATKASHVADHYDIKLVDAQGNWIPFDKVSNKPANIPVFQAPDARKKVGKDYSLDKFIAEFESAEDLHRIVKDLVTVLSTFYSSWYVGENAKVGMVYPEMYSKGTYYWPCILRTDGRVEIPFRWISQREPFKSHPELLSVFVLQLQDIFILDKIEPKGCPTFSLFMLGAANNLKKFENAIVWFMQVVLKDGMVPVELEVDDV